MTTFGGVIPAVVTPFTDDLSLDFVALRGNLELLLRAGIDTVLAAGTMGEASSLTEDERQALLSAIGVALAGRGSFVVGISADTAVKAARFAEQAADAGAVGLMCLPPTLYHADDRELMAFYSRVAHATNLPLMLYNNPEGSRNDLTPAQIGQLHAAGVAVAVKECSGDARRIAAICELTNGTMEVVVGGDDWALEGFCAGAIGWVSGCANVAPELSIDLFNACTRADMNEARQVYRRLLPLARLDMTPKLVQFYKAGLDRVGGRGGLSRPPRLALTSEDTVRLDAALEALAGDTSLVPV